MSVSKTDILQALLDTQKLAGDLFDAVEDDHVVIDRALVMKTSALINRLVALRQGFMLEYALSPQMTEDFMDSVRAHLGRAGNQ